MSDKRLITLVESLRREHHECDDHFYNCAKLVQPEDYSLDPAIDNYKKCTCGADKANEAIDKIIELLRSEEWNFGKR